MRTNTVKPGGLFRSSFGPTFALLVWLPSCTLSVAVERVDGRMRRMAVLCNWLEGLTATGPGPCLSSMALLLS